VRAELALSRDQQACPIRSDLGTFLAQSARAWSIWASACFQKFGRRNHRCAYQTLQAHGSSRSEGTLPEPKRKKFLGSN